MLTCTGKGTAHMKYRRSQRTRQHASFEDRLWSLSGLVALVLFFVLLNWLGIVLTSVLFGVILCIFFGLRYGLPSHLRSSKAAGGFGLTPPEQVRAQEKAPSNEYGQGYPARNVSRSTRRVQNSRQPKEERLADYDQPQAQYPEEMPPMA